MNVYKSVDVLQFLKDFFFYLTKYLFFFFFFYYLYKRTNMVNESCYPSDVFRNLCFSCSEFNPLLIYRTVNVNVSAYNFKAPQTQNKVFPEKTALIFLLTRPLCHSDNLCFKNTVITLDALNDTYWWQNKGNNIDYIMIRPVFTCHISRIKSTGLQIFLMA